jgi:hypothetical protein
MVRITTRTAKDPAKLQVATAAPVAAQTPAPATPESSESALAVNTRQRNAMIAEAAYFRSQQRGFLPGWEVEDWLAAETEVNRKLMGP